MYGEMMQAWQRMHKHIEKILLKIWNIPCAEMINPLLSPPQQTQPVQHHRHFALLPGLIFPTKKD